MKRIALPILILAMGLAIASPVGAVKPCELDPSHPSCKDDPPPVSSVELTIEANLLWAQEASDTIIYTISVDPPSADVEIASSLPAELVGEEGVFRQEYPVAPHYVGFQLGDDPITLTNTVEATIGDEVVATASADVELHHDYEECVFTTDLDDPQLMTSWACIWKPTEPGVWRVTVDPTPVARQQGANNIQITLRDHIPGNWCEAGVNEKWKWGEDPVWTDFTIPDWTLVSLGDPVCPSGGAGGDFFAVGAPDSFYLVASGYVSVSKVLPPEPPGI